MKITTNQLRKIIKEEVDNKRRSKTSLDTLREAVRQHVKIIMEAPTMDDLVDVLKKEKASDFDSLKDIISKFVEEGGDEDMFKDPQNLEKLKDAYKESGGKKEADVDTISKEISSGKMQLKGDVVSAAKSAAKILGDEEIAGQLAQVVTKVKGGTEIDSLSTNQLKPLAALGKAVIFGDPSSTIAASKKLATVGEKKP